MTAVKICGLKDTNNLRAAVEAGTDFVGFVFYSDSPRATDYHSAANLRQLTPAHVKAVGLFVNPTDAELEKYAGLRLDMLQLHGSETPERVAEIRRKSNLPVMKAIAVADTGDLKTIPAFESVADWILLDAKVPGEHGGTGQSFDWALLKGRTFHKPWMLSGGLNPGNVAEALKIAQPTAVDVSSGVESARGVKDSAKIRAFIETVKKS